MFTTVVSMKVMSPEAGRMKIMRKPDALFLSDMTVACPNFVRQVIASVVISVWLIARKTLIFRKNCTG